MLSLASLLNPAPPGPPISRFRSSPALSSPVSPFADEYSIIMERHLLSKQTMAGKDLDVFTKSKAKGSVNFRPFEELDEISLREVRRFQVYPFGKIQDFCRHIPYNSGKKDFYEKTNRESFEVFQYIFKVPEDDAEYTVMWDYNVGLVRMTPFFKCCKYSKTMPAKMLNMNPGLRDITHSITGGSIMAQGYWMPYACAKAICATFCQPIAGALIPIFGPEFPSQCVPVDAPEHGRMTIDPNIVSDSTREAEAFRRMYAAAHHHYPALPSPTSLPSPRSPQHMTRLAPFEYQRSQPPCSKRVREMDSPDTSGDAYSSPEMGMGKGNDRHGKYMISSIPPLRNTSGWTAANHASYHHNREPNYYGADPELSVVPRSSGMGLRALPAPPTHVSSWGSKRSAGADTDYDYDAGESQNGSSSPTNTPRGDGREDEELMQSGVDKNAAYLLMHLSVRDRQKGKYNGKGTGMQSSPPLDAKHRSKRRRATSM